VLEAGRGNLLDTDAEALVNTVNTVGVMGKGVALQFKRAFPDNFRAYAAACKRGEVRLGRMFVFDRAVLDRHRYIVNFPTKGHWRSNSRLADVEAGLADLVRTVDALGIGSIAVPALGCGNGGLAWRDVEPRIAAAFAALPHVRCVVFAPSGAPPPSDAAPGSRRPALTPFRARALAMMHRYSAQADAQHAGTEPGVSLLETQKLAYLGQQVGLDLNLTFEKGIYGPYSAVLDRALSDLEGHYFTGLGDRTDKVLDLNPIVVRPDAASAAERALADDPDGAAAIGRLLHLVDGFETAYGLELLSSVHYVARVQSAAAAHSPAAALAALTSWNRRKARLFTDRHVTAAWQRLDKHHLLAGPRPGPSRRSAP
jgi:O-acetyl-ADP-ribose deacetylase (regulator of RNase III)